MRGLVPRTPRERALGLGVLMACGAVVWWMWPVLAWWVERWPLALALCVGMALWVMGERGRQRRVRALVLARLEQAPQGGLSCEALSQGLSAREQRALTVVLHHAVREGVVCEHDGRWTHESG